GGSLLTGKTPRQKPAEGRGGAPPEAVGQESEAGSPPCAGLQTPDRGCVQAPEGRPESPGVRSRNVERGGQRPDPSPPRERRSCAVGVEEARELGLESLRRAPGERGSHLARRAGGGGIGAKPVSGQKSRGAENPKRVLPEVARPGLSQPSCPKVLEASEGIEP